MGLSSTGSNIALVILSGPVAVGKSSATTYLTENYRFHKISTGNFLRAMHEETGILESRTALQELGDTLDQKTDFSWVVDVAQSVINSNKAVERWIFDSVRKHRQVEHFRKAFDNNIFHVHLTADEGLTRIIHRAFRSRPVGVLSDAVMGGAYGAVRTRVAA